MRIGRNIAVRPNKPVGEIAPPAAGHQDLAADPGAPVDNQHAPPSPARGQGAHQAGSASADYDDIKMIVHQVFF